MIAVDTNILVYSHRKESAHYKRCFETVRVLAEGNATWAIAWPCLYEFFSVVTNARIWKQAVSSPEQAWRQVNAWTSSPSIRLLGETGDFLTIVEKFVLRPRVQGAIVHDARVAAICVAHGVEELLTADRDFNLFPELKTSNPTIN